ncbi:hypothetical protein EYF80_012990 [Liparis tanakae]|uniref:Uncharacterized protein n=1 Tax=Liparis tanakae TaxID=230148 RepID=A0A4Z2IG39_9TELE|nr:hypothetical protein EYF80_012990 [Liparis tanakae]
MCPEQTQLTSSRNYNYVLRGDDTPGLMSVPCPSPCGRVGLVCGLLLLASSPLLTAGSAWRDVDFTTSCGATVKLWGGVIIARGFPLWRHIGPALLVLMFGVREPVETVLLQTQRSVLERGRGSG